MTKWSNGGTRLTASGVKRALMGGVALAMLSAGGAVAAEKMVSVPESVWNELLANQREMQQELTTLRGSVQDTQQNLQLIRGQQNEISTQVESVRGSVPDESKLVRDGKTGVELTLSGQVNKGVLFADSGDEPSPLPGGDQGRNVYVVDNDASSSRLKFEGKAKIDSLQTFGAVIEVEFESNSTQDVNQRDDGDSPSNDNNFKKRKIEVYYENKNLGKIWIGQGDTASNGTTEKDLSGTDIATGYSDVPTTAGGISFRMAGGVLSTSEIKDVFNNFDGASRKERVRLDTPKWHGTQFSASYINGGDFDAGIHHEYKWDILGGTAIAAGAHYYDSHGVGTTDFSQFGGSVSALHVPTGINLTFATGQRFNEGTSQDPYFYYAKGGVIFDWFNIGGTAVAVDYMATFDNQMIDDEATAYGAYIVQNIDDTATEIYAGIRLHELDRPGSSFQDILAGIVGVRQKF